MTPEAATQWASQVGLRLRYDADLNLLAGANAPFVRLSLDPATATYIANAPAARHGRLRTGLHRIMRLFLSDFDVNGLLGTYPMHVLSKAQWQTLLAPLVRGDEPMGRLLDVGAGRGDATAQLATLFEETLVSETSGPMARRLRRMGYECLQQDVTHALHLAHSFNAVSLLNVLDRCDNPVSLLGAARSALRPGGLLLIALVLPYRPFVYDQGSARAPRQRLPIVHDTWEVAAAEFVTMCLVPLGLEIVSLSRAPYLSGGDADAPLYELDDLIVVCRADSAIPLVGP